MNKNVAPKYRVEERLTATNKLTARLWFDTRAEADEFWARRTNNARARGTYGPDAAHRLVLLGPDGSA